VGEGSSRPGRFIVLEGIDGAGTTTQSARLVAWLRSRGAIAHGTHQPSGGPIGNLIRQILRGRVVATLPDGGAEPVDPAAVALLFAADRLDHLHAEVEPLLASGCHVVCDRYVLSSLAYQGLDTERDFVRMINARARTPDLTVLLAIRPEVGMARIAGRAGRDSFERLAIQQRVAANYEEVVDSPGAGRVVVVDGEAEPDAVTEAVQRAVEGVLGEP